MKKLLLILAISGIFISSYGGTGKAWILAGTSVSKNVSTADCDATTCTGVCIPAQTKNASSPNKVCAKKTGIVCKVSKTGKEICYNGFTYKVID